MDDGYLPALLPFAGAVAARTDKVSIGTNVLLMPFHHPIRMAEDCAVVDNLSDGRFIFGPAVGYRLEEFASFGVDRRQRGSITEEAITIIKQCWTEDEFDFQGRHFEFSGVRCTPKPVQQPRIPIWIGAVQGEAIRRAARLSDGLLANGRRVRAKYVTALREAGKDADHPHMASTDRWIFCSNEPKKDWAALRKHALYQMQNYARWFSEAGQPLYREPPKNLPDLESRGLYCVATPDEIVEVIRSEHAAAPFECYYFWAIWPGMEVAVANRSVRLFAERVIPELSNL